MTSLADLPIRDSLRGLTPYGAPQLQVPVALNVNENAHAVPQSVIDRAIGTSSLEGITGGDRIERRAPAYHARVRWGYLQLAAREPERFVVISTKGKAPEQIFAESIAALQQRFPGRF